MATTKYTPGPWRWFRQRHHSQAIEQWWIDSGTRKAMALLEVWDINHNPEWRAEHPEVMKEYAETVEEVEANARLIAAAPDLLAVLEEFIAADERAVSEMAAYYVPPPEYVALHEKARAAIQKATGEENA